MLEALLAPLWRDNSPDPDEQRAVLRQIEVDLQALWAWHKVGSGGLEDLFEGVEDD